MSLLIETSEATIFNSRISKNYPELDFMLKDIDGFKKEMSDRFKRQKELTPDTPFAFDYSELGHSTYVYMKDAIDKKLLSLKGTHSPQFKEALLILKGLIDQNLNTGKITYLDTVKHSYYFSHIFSEGQNKNLGIKERLLLWQDRIAQGYRKANLEKVIDIMKMDRMDYFPIKTNVSNFNDAAIDFERALRNTDELETLLLPTHLELGLNVMYRLLPHNIHLVGVTSAPIAADGYVRGSGHFFIHDLRHSSLIFYKLKKYYKLNQATINQERKITELSSRALVAFIRSARAIEDDTLRRAVIHTSFALHHEQGLPLLASSYKGKKAGHMVYLSYFVKRFGGQDPKFRSPQKNVVLAYEWLQSFWKRFESEEKEIMQKEIVPIPIGRLPLDE
jgi:hypothetical protein